MNPLTSIQGISSALSAVGSAIVGKPDTSAASVGDYGNTVTSGGPISSGGGSATSGLGGGSILLYIALGLGAFLLVHHAFKK